MGEVKSEEAFRLQSNQSIFDIEAKNFNCRRSQSFEDASGLSAQSGVDSFQQFINMSEKISPARGQYCLSLGPKNHKSKNPFTLDHNNLTEMGPSNS